MECSARFHRMNRIECRFSACLPRAFGHNLATMTATLDLSPILKSPRLPEISATLVNRLRDESERRERFYNEMSDDQKVEFIDGEVIVHSPTRTYGG